MQSVNICFVLHNINEDIIKELKSNNGKEYRLVRVYIGAVWWASLVFSSKVGGKK